MIKELSCLETRICRDFNQSIAFFEKTNQEELNKKYRCKRVELHYGNQISPKLLFAEVVNCDVTFDCKRGLIVSLIVFNGRDVPFKVGFNGIKRFL
jgi:hypothetical protein